jgi:hypothetical protein
LLQQEPTHAQVLELAEKIGKIVNRRTFDLRDKTIEELTQLDSTLSTLQILPDKNIKYFTVLTDNWLFANLPSRRSGLSYEANITANLFSNAAFTQQTELLYDTIASRFNDNTIGAGTGFIFSLTYEKPISIKWQQSANAYIAPKFTYQGNKLENLIGTTSTDAQIPSMELGGSYTLGYYPNTRTYLTIGLDEFAKLYQLKQESSSTSYLIYNSQARANLYYFFSPTLRLQAQLGLLFSHYRQNPETNGNTTKISNTWLNLGATLVYSVF